jgi:hypothetical protein
VSDVGQRAKMKNELKNIISREERKQERQKGFSECKT